MNRKKKRMEFVQSCFIVLLALLSAPMIFAGGQQDAVPADFGVDGSQEKIVPEIITMIDSKGRTVSVTGPVKKVAFSHYAIGDGLKILDAWSLVVAKDSFTSDPLLFPGIHEIPAIAPAGRPYDVNYEKLFELNPDVLITSDLPLSGFDEMIAKLESDIPVVALNLQDPEALGENLVILGRLLGKEEEAREYLLWYESIINSLSEKTAGLSDKEKTRILQRTGWGDNLMTFSDEYPGIRFRNNLTGSINVAGTLPSQGGWVQSLDPEWLVLQDIDVIVNFDIVPQAYGTGIDDNSMYKNYREDLMGSPLFSSTDAVGNNRFFMIANEFWGTMKNIIGYAYMAKWFHPELFEDFDPQQVHQEYLTRFMRVDYDLQKHGVFVYPEE